ncbi:MAG: four helix bundle protein [Polyangiaceae bacterium]
MTGQVKGARPMNSFNFQKLDVYLAAKSVAVSVQAARITDNELRDQATRAAKSCFLNLSEGLPSRQGGMRRKHFAAALGSVAELSAAFDLAIAIGAVGEDAELAASVARLAALVGALLK